MKKASSCQCDGAIDLTDQCGNEAVFEQDFQRAVVVPAGLCKIAPHALPVVNGHPHSGFDHGWHVLLGNDLLQDTLIIHR